MTESQVIEVLRRYMDRHKNGNLAAKKLGYGRGYLVEVIAGRRPVTNGLAEALGFEVVYRRME